MNNQKHNFLKNNHRTGALILKLSVLAAACSYGFSAQADTVNCPKDRPVWFVEAGAPNNGKGTGGKPLNSVAQINACTQTGQKIKIKPSSYPLTGSIILKAGQSIEGMGPKVTKQAAVLGTQAPMLEVRAGEGLILADDVTVKNLMITDIDAPLPGPSAMVSGSLVDGGVTLKDLVILKQSQGSGGGAIFINVSGEGNANSVKVSNVQIETIDSNGPEPANWMGGIFVRAFGQQCIEKTLNVELNDVEVINTRQPLTFLQSCTNNMHMNLVANDVSVTNGISDHFLIRNSGSLHASIDSYHSYNNPAVKTDVLAGSFSPAFSAGTTFGFEYFGSPSAREGKITMRNSLISQSIGPALGILQFVTAQPDTNLTLDFGCLESDCEARGLQYGEGNNAFINSVPSANGILGADYSSYLTSPLGIPLLFPGPVSVDSNIANGIGNEIALYMDTPGDVQLVGQGNYWGGAGQQDGLGICAEQGGGFGPGGFTFGLTNEAIFDNGVQWTCALNNLFSFAAFPQQPLTDYALSYAPN